ncbi:unnamed protein product [Dimorphilus gyrociliatus]|uniref:RING-type domain-containing protein n=1 Tax=Dimorphilus gyrociliatus TaxID=2664684 RepID=A0A7I8VEL3_9ANNE|nr:unnamed protein product [Dimorphilus gyrociliatus]
MAASASTEYVLKQEELICAICVDSWLERDPRVLPCNHTFCFICLKSLLRGGFAECPICRAKVNLMGRNINDIPKNSLPNAIEKIEPIVQVCTTHKRKILKPLLCCKTCRKLNLCALCIDIDHSMENCFIVTVNSLENRLRKLRSNYKVSINQHEMKISKTEAEVIRDIEETRNYHIADVRNQSEKMIQKVKRYYQEKRAELKDNSNEINNILITEADVENQLRNLSVVEKPTVNSCPSKLSVYFNYKSHGIYKNFKRIRQQFFPMTETESHFIANDGFYCISKSNRATLMHQESFGSSISKATLDRNVEKIVITDRYLYVIECSYRKIMIACRPFYQFIDLRPFSSIEANDIKAIDIEEDSFVLTFNSDASKCSYFINKNYQWHCYSCRELGCILKTGNPIIKTSDCRYVMMDKYKGIEIMSMKCPANAVIYNLHPLGLLIANTVVFNENSNDGCAFEKSLKKASPIGSKWHMKPAFKGESGYASKYDMKIDRARKERINKMNLLLFDYQMNQNIVVNRFENVQLLGTTDDSLICLYSSGDNYRVYKY